MDTLRTHPLHQGMIYGEGIRWHAGRLWVSDIYAHQILEIDPSSGAATVVAHLDDRPSGLGFAPNGSLLAVTMLDRRLVAALKGSSHVIASLSDLVPPDSVVNDMVVDGGGYAFVGFHAFPDPSQGSDGIVLVTPAGEATVVARDLRMPNGMAVTPDRRLIVAETRGARIVQYPIAPDGSLGPQSVFAELPGHKPDGIGFDTNGRVWVSSASAGQLLAVGEGGAVHQSFELPGGRWPVAIVFGGEGRSRLFIVSTETSTEELYRVGRVRELDASLSSNSRIEWCDVGATGAGYP